MPYQPSAPDDEEMMDNTPAPDEPERPGQSDSSREEEGEVAPEEGTLLPSGLDAGVVSYYESPEGFGCARCVFFDSEGQSCAVVDGTVTERGCCDLWEDDTDARYTGPKLDKAAVVYLEDQSPSGRYICGECRFLEPDGTCAVVGGTVSRDTGTCTQWQPVKGESGETPEEPKMPEAPAPAKRLVRRGPMGAPPAGSFGY